MAETIASMEKPPNRFAGDQGFKDKTLLITGGTGFMGKVLIEKILRTCPLVKRIYVLVRSKKGKTGKERMEEIFSGPLFDLLKQTVGEATLGKVVAVNGDVFDEDLQLSPDNRKLLREEVQIIYHMAATVRFDEPFNRTILLNTRGTKFMVKLAHECQQLLAFVHVSTAYCHLGEKVLYEKTYPPPANPHTMINLVETMEEEIVNVVAKKVMGSTPYPYSFSKALAEDLINDEMQTLPVIIVRPSVVIPMWKDPIRGWTDNINGPTGLLIAGGKGVLRSVYGNPKTYIDYLPVDTAANLTMMATYDYINHRTRRVYHLTSSFEVKVTFDDLIRRGKEASLAQMPLNWVVWYPGGWMTSSKLFHNINAVLFHYIPALIIDFLILLAGRKPIMWKIHQRISKGVEILTFYSTHQWDFNNDKLLEARNLMNQTEKEIYVVEGKSFDFDSYLYHATHAARLYLLKEGDETLPTAKRHMKIMWALDKFCKTMTLVGFGYLLLHYVVYPILGINQVIDGI